ncbi:orotidine 5'-phosphate decarboxylase [Chryseomicrobium palamuruense]
MTKIQLALDRLTKESCHQLIRETVDFIDIVEIGSGVIKQYGMEFVKEIKVTYPTKEILVDMKTCDAGRAEAEQAYNAGADWTTVMSFASNTTIQDVLDVSRQFTKSVYLDMMNCHNQSRIQELYKIGVRNFNIHIPIDQQTSSRWSEKLFSSYSNLEGINLVLSGGIGLEDIKYLSSFKPAIVIVGSAITKSEHPKQVAQAIREEVNRYAARSI